MNDCDSSDVQRLFPTVVYDNDNSKVICQVSIKEIRTAVKQLGSHKAPGPDGLRPLLDKIISSNQHAFVSGRSIFDSTVICNEIVHSFKKKKGKKGWMALKLDFDKAYDRVLTNGSPSKSFNPYNGLIHRDPLSPFMFIIFLEALSRLINERMRNREIIGISMATGAHVISRSLWSGQRISDTKSTLLTYANLGRIFSRGMAASLKVQVTQDPANRMQGWKSKTLNMAGISTLIRSVLDPVSNHVMSMLKIPKGLLNRLNKYKKNFLCGGDKDKRTLHKLRWIKVCFPIEYGEIGIRDLELNNLALLAKMAWRVSNNPESDVSSLLKVKYYPETDFWCFGTKSKCSTSWRSILSGRDAVRDCLRWNIGNGNSVDLCNESCLYNLPISSIAIDNNMHLPNIKVRGIMNMQERCWNLEEIDAFISEQVAGDIKARPIAGGEDLVDKLLWSENKSGIATVKEAYNYLISKGELGVSEPNADWRVVGPLWRKVQSWIGFQPVVDHISPTTLKNWCNFEGKIAGIEWKHLMPFVLWSIGRGRNDCIFRRIAFQPNRVLAKALKEAREFIGFTQRMTKDQQRTIEVPVLWIYPKQDYAKMNCD
ncbi:uncharacterized protein LOC113346321 [Papaver somniferum]|uniref:uncharacterized protein LOC113346321 n=1 Tax=Papaver somniferum TaxID=3469 RepID=UPI000E6F9EF4|nr:uncharacterized protein LOC113346321 [Papaver somniferum]